MAFEVWDQLLEDEHNALAGMVATLLQDGPNVPQQTKAQVVIMTVVFRTMSFYQAIKLLFAAGAGIDAARTLIRACIENLFVCVVLAEEGDTYVERMVRADRTATQKFAEFILSEKLYSDEADADFWKAQAKGARDAGTGAFSMPGEIGKGTQAKAAYYAYSEMSNDAAHVTMRALGRYLSMDQREFVPAPVTSASDRIGSRSYLSMSLLSTMLAIIQAYGRAPAIDLVGPLWDRHVALANAHWRSVALEVGTTPTT